MNIILPQFLENSINTKKGMFILSLVLYCYILTTTYPIYLERLGSSPSDTSSFFFKKITAPLEAVSDSKDTHGSKAAFRMTVPLIAKFLDLGIEKDARKVVLIYIMQSILLLPFLYLLTELFKRHLRNLHSIFMLLAFSSIYVCKAFFWDIDYWFDGFAYFFLLLGMYFQNRWWIFCALTLACWTDERAVIALGAVTLFHLLQENDFSLDSFTQIFNKNSVRKPSFIPLLTIFCYAVVRIFLSINYALHTPFGKGTGLGVNLIPTQLNGSLVGIFLTFEGLWLVFSMAMCWLYNQRKILLLVMFGMVTLLHIIVAYSVYDITRSLTYAFPIMITCTIFISKKNGSSIDSIFAISSLLCFFIPTQFLIGGAQQVPWLIFSLDRLGPVWLMFSNALHSYL